MVSISKLKKIVQNYYDELSFKHPFVNSDKFFQNSYSKWACKEILKDIDAVEAMPFDLTPIEILDQFSEKMKSYAYKNSKNSLIFVIASETAEYLIEQCWISEWRKTRKG